MRDDEFELLLMVIAGAACGGILGKKLAGSTFLGILAGAATAAIAGPRIVSALEHQLGRQLSSAELHRLEAAIRQ